MVLFLSHSVSSLYCNPFRTILMDCVIDTVDQIFARMNDAMQFDPLETVWALIA